MEWGRKGRGGVGEVVVAGFERTWALVCARIAQARPPSRPRPEPAPASHRGRTPYGRPTSAGGGRVGEAAAAYVSAEQLKAFATAAWSRCAAAMAATAAPDVTGQLFRATGGGQLRRHRTRGWLHWSVPKGDEEGRSCACSSCHPEQAEGGVDLVLVGNGQ